MPCDGSFAGCDLAASLAEPRKESSTRNMKRLRRYPITPVKIGGSIEPMGQRWKCHHALGGLARPRVWQIDLKTYDR
jgi:hypothetical protein